MFADDTSLFSVIHDVDASANELNNDLYQINKWAFQWKMSFNPDPSKQTQEIIFSKKTKKICHPSLRFNNSIVSQSPHQKHLGIFFDARLNFEEHLKAITTKVNRTIGLLRKLQKALRRPALMTMYKAFVRPHLDYGDQIYDEAYNELFQQKLESIQYNTCLALSGAIRGSSREKLYHELALESLQCRRWYRKLCLFYKIFKEKKPAYLFNLIPSKNPNYITRNTDKVTPFHTKHNFFKNSFFQSTVIEWNKLDPNLRSAASLSVFKKNLLKFIRPSPNSVFNCHNCKGIKYLTRLRLCLSHLREHKFKHNFQDTLNPFCSCGLDVETNRHFFLYCPLFTNQRRTLLSTVKDIDSSLTNTNDSILTHFLLFGKASLDTSANTLLLNATMSYIISTNRFEESLF